MKKPLIQVIAKWIYSLTEYSQWTTFHTTMLSLLATGIFMVFSADEMGAIGPILLSHGICVIFFVLVCELLLTLRVLIKHLIIRLASASPKSS